MWAGTFIAPCINVANQLANVSGNIYCTLHDKISTSVHFFEKIENDMVEKGSYGFAKCSWEILGKVLGAKSYPGDMFNDEESNWDRLLENESKESRLIVNEKLVA